MRNKVISKVFAKPTILQGSENSLTRQMLYPMCLGVLAAGILLLPNRGDAQDATDRDDAYTSMNPTTAFIPMPNPGIVSPAPSGTTGWGDAVHNEGVRLYKKGQYAKAAIAYKRACDRFAKACTNLGFMYNRGQGLKINHSLAAEYYRRGCHAGDGLGCTNLGVMYWNRDLPKDDNQAAELFERAVATTTVERAGILAICLRTGTASRRTKAAQPSNTSWRTT